MDIQQFNYRASLGTWEEGHYFDFKSNNDSNAWDLAEKELKEGEDIVRIEEIEPNGEKRLVWDEMYGWTGNSDSMHDL